MLISQMNPDELTKDQITKVIFGTQEEVNDAARSPYLQAAAPHAYAEINETDAEALSLVPGEVVRISSPRGWIEVPARIGTAAPKGLVFVPFHYGSRDGRQAANELTADFTDPLSKQPTFKQSACRIDKLRKTHIWSGEDTLEAVSERYGISVEDLKKANRLISAYDIQRGACLEIPVSTMNVPLQPYTPYMKPV